MRRTRPELSSSIPRYRSVGLSDGLDPQSIGKTYTFEVRGIAIIVQICIDYLESIAIEMFGCLKAIERRPDGLLFHSHR